MKLPGRWHPVRDLARWWIDLSQLCFFPWPNRRSEWNCTNTVSIVASCLWRAQVQSPSLWWLVVQHYWRRCHLWCSRNQWRWCWPKCDQGDEWWSRTSAGQSWPESRDSLSRRCSLGEAIVLRAHRPFGRVLRRRNCRKCARSAVDSRSAYNGTCTVQGEHRVLTSGGLIQASKSYLEVEVDDIVVEELEWSQTVQIVFGDIDIFVW